MPVPLPLLSLVLRVADSAAVVVAMLLATYVIGDRLTDTLVAHLDRVTLLAVTVLGIVAQLSGAYDADVLFSIRRGWSRILNAWAGTALFMLAMGFMLRLMPHASRSWIIAWFVLATAAIALCRAALVVGARRMRRAGTFNHRSAIFGAGAQGADLARYVMEHDKLTLSVLGFFDDAPPQDDDACLPLPLLGGMAELVAAIRAGWVDQVIIALPWSDEIRLRAIVDELAMTPVRIRLAPERAGFIYAQRPVMLLGGLPVMTLMERPISGMQRIEKWLEDRVISALLLVLCAPAMLLIALAIRIESPGPVLFRQPREGFNCRAFSIFKFRTMYADRAETQDVVQARRRDPRITRVGAVLRRTSLDELPQLFNVLLGHMSLVGPRPHAPSTRAGGKLFGEVIASYAARHKVKPGLTGWAQVCGWRGETDTEEKLIKRLEHDLYYVENWSLSFDLYILLRTAATVLMHRQAY